MRSIMGLAVVLAVAGGLVGAFAYGELFGEAGAVPAPIAVREQNLDASGFIRVHEQGTANVNVTNGSLPVSGTVDVGNLPTVQDVNVLSLPSTSGRLIELGTQSSAGQDVTFPMADVRDCRKISILAQGGTNPSIFFPTNTSPDGTTPIEVFLDGGSFRRGSGSASAEGLDIVLPFLQVRVHNEALGLTATAWIWCVP